DFYRFNRDYKKNINSIEIHINKLISRTSIPGIEFETPALDKKDLETLKRLENIFQQLMKTEPLYECNISFDILEAIKENRVRVPTLFLNEVGEATLDSPHKESKSNIKVKLINKLLPFIKKNTKEVKAKVYDRGNKTYITL